MHPKEDKRVYRSVKSLSKHAKVLYQYLSETEEDVYEEGNITYIPIKWLEPKNVHPLVKLAKRRSLDKKVLEIVVNTEYDILYMHHFLPSRPLLPFRIAKERGKRVIYDVHEYHPQNFLADLPQPVARIKEEVVKKIFLSQLKLSDALIFVTPDVPEDLNIRKLNKPYIVVPNFAEDFVPTNIDIQQKKNNKLIIYVGKVTRRLDEEKALIKKLTFEGFSLRIIGMDDSYFADLPHTYSGFLPYDEMMREISLATFSLVSFTTTGKKNYKNDLYSLPHKFYDSLAAGTPVIVKESFVSMRRIVEQLGVGITIDPTDVEKSLRKLLSAYQRYHEIVQNILKYRYEFVWDEKKEEEFAKFVIF
ncbi:glycosyl transferase family 1 [Fervidobacterium thailandense]|uniref:Glycosyl transferase family 1 n=2 Tax=Fervidobacterium thailandense TaxID=1008305 RepID=A0A1E3G0I8_9BACT|nr:glycosyl transferase family 1 [Fervidobacterium thailandense]